MKKLWEKNYSMDKFAEEYCFGRSVVYDTRLAVVDALGSIAHAQMLAKIGILTDGEFDSLKKELIGIIKLAESGKYVVHAEDEDVHTKIENDLTQKVGDAAKKIHTARSRNDQVVLDLRLYAKEELFALSMELLSLTKSFQEYGIEHEFVPMPGYTHTQKAMPSSVGMWMGSFAENLLDDIELLKSAFVVTDQSPLGAAASYGVSLPIDRELTARLLGFAKVQNNTLATQSSRIKFQLSIMHGLTQTMLTLSRFAQDMLTFTTSEYNFFTVDQALCTGSSIMPQKKNLDVMEVLRARAHAVIGYEHMAASTLAGLPSGYNSDFGETKEYFMNALDTTRESIHICQLVLKSMEPNKEVLEKACTPDLFATHEAFLLVQKGMPFREAYRKVGLALDKIPNHDPSTIIKASNHSGGPGNLQLQTITKAIEEEQKWWKGKETNYQNAITQLMRQ
jgi:argininosuccinate lyase